MKAAEILKQAAKLVSGDRAISHGPAEPNHQNIANLWNSYLANRGSLDLLSSQDIAIMMALLKIARTQLGEHNEDDYVDAAAYMALAGEIARK